jgi:hypothetical protein
MFTIIIVSFYIWIDQYFRITIWNICWNVSIFITWMAASNFVSCAQECANIWVSCFSASSCDTSGVAQQHNANAVQGLSFPEIPNIVYGQLVGDLGLGIRLCIHRTTQNEIQAYEYVLAALKFRTQDITVRAKVSTLLGPHDDCGWCRRLLSSGIFPIKI